MKNRRWVPKRYTLAVQAGVVSALALGVILVRSEPTRALMRAACDATFEPTSVPTGAEAATVFYQLSEDIGELHGASADRESGLAVIGHDGEMSTLSLNTTEATPGTWPLTLHGEDDQECAGSIEVTQPGAEAV